MSKEEEMVTLRIRREDLISAHCIRSLAEEERKYHNMGNARCLEAIADEIENVR